MKQRIEVRSQLEFDACIKAGNIAIVIGCSVVAWGNSSVVAWENSSVVARENSSVVAWGNSSVVAWENSSVVARENSSVVARENSSVVAWGNVFVRLFSALKIKISAHVVLMRHNNTMPIDGGRQLEAAPEPKTGAEWCEFNGISQDAPFKIPNIDAKIFEAIDAGKGKLDMDSWHGIKEVNEENWCGTTHCRAGYAICLAGKAGFDLEKKYDSELAGKMIYAASRPDKELPDFHADNDDVLEELKAAHEKFINNKTN